MDDPHARAHRDETDDGLVGVVPMLDRIANWDDYLSEGADRLDQMLELHERTGRPLGNSRFIDQLESIAGCTLRPGQPGVKPKCKS